MERRFKVPGLRCSHCIEILERNLKRLTGVRRVTVTPSASRIVVDCNPYRVSDTMLEAAIRDAGFWPKLEVPPKPAPVPDEAGAPDEPGPG